VQRPAAGAPIGEPLDAQQRLLRAEYQGHSACTGALNRAIARHELDPGIDQELIIDLLVGPMWTRLLITREPITTPFVDDIVDAVIRAFPPPAAAAGDELRREQR
jgi:hypothetical protein